MIIAIDPGPTTSGIVWLSESTSVIRSKAEMNNFNVLNELTMVADYLSTDVVIEMIASYGMPVGAEVFETCVWIGQFMRRWYDVSRRPAGRLFRREVKLHLCGNVAAKDPNVRQALIDRFGPGRAKAIGTKRAPGPLYGVTGDAWAALAVGVTWRDKGGRVVT